MNGAPHSPSKTNSVVYFYLYYYFYTRGVEVYARLLERMELICRLATTPTPALKQERERKSEDEEQRGEQDLGGAERSERE